MLLISDEAVDPLLSEWYEPVTKEKSDSAPEGPGRTMALVGMMAVGRVFKGADAPACCVTTQP